MWRRGRSQQLCAGTLCRNSTSDKVSQVNKGTKFYFASLLAGLYTLVTNILEGYSEEMLYYNAGLIKFHLINLSCYY